MALIVECFQLKYGRFQGHSMCFWKRAQDIQLVSCQGCRLRHPVSELKFWTYDVCNRPDLRKVSSKSAPDDFRSILSDHVKSFWLKGRFVASITMQDLLTQASPVILMYWQVHVSVNFSESFLVYTTCLHAACCICCIKLTSNDLNGPRIFDLRVIETNTMFNDWVKPED